MSQPVIKVEGLGKRYQLGVTHAGSVRELVNRTARRMTGRREPAPAAHAAGSCSESADHIWALRDVSFEVQAGEVLGIIGRNGAGKSTLLKILSQITRPTEGRAELRGRVASLLEVGTGFHPELTGRENVYMNGTVLGMSRSEIDRQFDSIVDFSGVETFIDTPVKRYSSGMTVRLGFAVAAHLSPEILIIDEVLAVGDAEFQKRCVGKMDEVAKAGQTVLLVSHNMTSIRQLAPRSLVMIDGTLGFDGPTETAQERYLGFSKQLLHDPAAVEHLQRSRWAGDRSVEFIEARIVGNSNRFPSAPGAVQLKIRSRAGSGCVRIGVAILVAGGAAVGTAFGEKMAPFAKGETRDVQLLIEPGNLAPGHYCLRLTLFNESNHLTDWVDEVLYFEITDMTGLPDGFLRWDPWWGGFQFRVSQVALPTAKAGNNAR